MSSASTTAPHVYRRQTPTIWQSLGQALWRTLQQVGQRRASRELRAMAQRWEPFDAALAQQLRTAARQDTTTSDKEAQ